MQKTEDDDHDDRGIEERKKKDGHLLLFRENCTTRKIHSR